MPRYDLAHLLSPYTHEEFIDRYLDRDFLYIDSRDQGKLADLLDWNALNALLRTHQMEAPRFRVAKEGTILPRETYGAMLDGPYGSCFRLDVPKFTRTLREGGTLVFDGLDQIHDPVTRLAVALEKDLRTRVFANAYASWRTSNGFDLHFDKHDVFILQLYGKKLWELHGDSEKHPIEALGQKAPTGGPVWCGYLKPGDILYIPRGVWHVAYPCEEPVLHLTVGFNSPTALDLLSWVTKQLAREECMRRSIPRFAQQGVQQTYLAEVTRLIQEVLAPSDLVRRFLDERDTLAEPRPDFGFPWIATPSVIPLSDHAMIVGRLPLGMLMTPSDDPSRVWINYRGVSIAYDIRLLPVLEAVISGDSISLHDIYEQFEAAFGRDNLRMLLSDLAQRDMIVVAQPNAITSTTDLIAVRDDSVAALTSAGKCQ